MDTRLHRSKFKVCSVSYHFANCRWLFRNFKMSLKPQMISLMSRQSSFFVEMFVQSRRNSGKSQIIAGSQRIVQQFEKQFKII